MRRTASKIYNGWRIQSRNIIALMIRSLMLKYGRGNIGFVWFALEPILLVIGITFIWTLIGGTHGRIRAVELVLTGYLPLTLWRHMTGPVVHIFRSNIPALFHRHISIFDVIMSRMLLDFLGTTAALLLFLGALIITGAVEGIQSLDYFVLGWFMMAWIGMASGILIAAITEFSEVAERFVGPLQYINLPISGCFIMVDWLPPLGQQLILWHPLVHCYEVFRRGYFGETVPTHFDIPYFVICAFLLSFFAVVSLERVRTHIEV